MCIRLGPVLKQAFQMAFIGIPFPKSTFSLFPIKLSLYCWKSHLRSRDNRLAGRVDLQYHHKRDFSLLGRQVQQCHLHPGCDWSLQRLFRTMDSRDSRDGHNWGLGDGWRCAKLAMVYGGKLRRVQVDLPRVDAKLLIIILIFVYGLFNVVVSVRAAHIRIQL